MSDYFIKDKWATSILGINSYISEKTEGFEINKIQQFKNNLNQDAFITLKVNTKNINDILLLQKLGFLIVDTLIQYSLKPKYFYKNSQKIIDKSNFFIKSADINEKEKIAKVAYDEFKFSRFHLDPLIPNLLASKFKYEWVLNYFLGNRGHNLFVAKEKEDGEILGFILLKDQINFNNDMSSTGIDLLATVSKFNKKGVASALVAFSVDKYINFNKILVGTQAVNIPANNLYQRLGFRMENSTYIFHYHYKHGN